MGKKGKRRGGAQSPPAQSPIPAAVPSSSGGRQGGPPTGDLPVAPTNIAARLGHILGLLSITLLPLASGGYSGWGYQFGFVLLPLAALLCLPALRLSRWAAGALAITLLLGSIAINALTGRVHAGVVLWYCMLALLAAWIVTLSLQQSSPDLARWLPPSIAISATLTALAGLFPWWGHYLNAGDFDYYVVSTFGLHNAYAGFLLLAWPTAAIVALQSSRSARYLLWTACGLLIATLFLTLSKASIAVFFLQLLILLLAGTLRIARGRAAPRVLWPALAGGGALLVALFALPTIRGALAQLTDFGGYSMQGRLRFWDAALRMFADHPWTGVGLGNFRYAYPQYQRDWMYYSVDPHSWALQLLAELGVWGGVIAVAFAIGFGLWVRRAVRAELASARSGEDTSGGPLTTAEGDKLPPYAAFSATGLLIVVAVGGSLLHALFDFDYTFAATTALLGVLLAYGSFRLPDEDDPVTATSAREFANRQSARALKGIAAVWLLFFVVIGQLLTLERFVLDELRNPGLTVARQTELLRQALSFVPTNEATQLELAEVLALQVGKGSEESIRYANNAVGLARRWASPHALLGALARQPEVADAEFQRALELDPYNHPEYYFAWAQAAQTPQQRYERLKLGIERIPAEHLITLDHVRAPDWYGFNPTWAKWWNQLAELEKDEQARRRYREIAARFRAAAPPPPQ